MYVIPGPLTTHGLDYERDLLGRELDGEEFSGREYLWDASEFEALDPSFISGLFGDIGK